MNKKSLVGWVYPTAILKWQQDYPIKFLKAFYNTIYKYIPSTIKPDERKEWKKVRITIEETK